MADQIQVSVKISEQEYDMLKTIRELDEQHRMQIYNLIKTLKDFPEGYPGNQFIQDLEQLRGTLDAEEFEAFKQSLAVFD